MIKIKSIISLRILVFLGLIIFLSFSKSYSSKLIVGASFAPPYYNVDGVNVTGTLANIMTEVVSEAGFHLFWKPAPTKRVYNNLINGKTDIYLGPLTPNLEGFEDSIIHSRFSPATIELRCYYLGNRSIITKKEDLQNKKILIIRGYTYGGLVNYILDPENNIEYCEVDSFDQAMKMLKNRRFDYHLDYMRTGEIYLENNIDKELMYSTLSSVDLYFMVSNRLPDAKNVLAKIENTFLQNREK